ncbi:MAG: hypothetical protein ACKO6N_21420 [Myxococcota bacterium]
MSAVRPEQLFDLFRLLEALEAHARRGETPSTGEAAPSLEALGIPLEGSILSSGGRQGRVFRVKPGYNPNSSSLGTSVVTLLWGVALAGVLFQLVGQWLLTQTAQGQLMLAAGEGGASSEPVAASPPHPPAEGVSSS